MGGVAYRSRCRCRRRGARPGSPAAAGLCLALKEPHISGEERDSRTAGVKFQKQKEREKKQEVLQRQNGRKTIKNNGSKTIKAKQAKLQDGYSKKQDRFIFS